MCKNTGFTLIELLVVVLIIGILSAVALPQYQKAVEKSRAAEAMSVIRTLRTGQDAYYMANGAHTNDINELDIQIPGAEGVFGGVPRRKSKWFSYAVRPASREYVIANRIPEDTQYVLWFNGENVVCRGISALGKKVCKSFSGQVTVE